MKVRFQFEGWRAWCAFALVVPLCGGCASSMDVLTSQRFKDAPFHAMFHTDDPYELLKSEDANDRAKAMLLIKEPKHNGGAEKEQFALLQTLATAATMDKHALCRMRAIEALAQWDDPRVAHIVVVAYHTAPHENPMETTPTAETGIVQVGRRTRSLGPVSSYTSDTIVTIQCRALEALGKRRTPEGLALLCEVASTPSKRETKQTEIDALGVGSSGQDQFDLRLAALRSLQNFKGEPAAAQVFYKVMTTEHDVALRNRAYEGLVKTTGQSYAPSAPEWKSFVRIADGPPAGLPAAITGQTP